jgi:hypothetical protein
MVPSIILPPPGHVGPVLMMGDYPAQQFQIRLIPGPSPIVAFSDGSPVLKAAPLANITSITVTGLGGGDKLTIDNASGYLAKTSGLPIVYHEGPGSNQLIVVGASRTQVPINETYAEAPSSGPLGTPVPLGKMVLSSTAGPYSQTIYLSNVAAVTDTLVAASLAISTDDRDDSISISNGASLPGPSLLMQSITPTLDAVFVPITSINKSYVAVDGVAGNNTIYFNVTQIPTGLSSMYLDGGTGTNNTMWIVNMPKQMNCTWDNIQHVYWGPGGGVPQSNVVPSAGSNNVLDAAFIALAKDSGSATSDALPGPVAPFASPLAVL